MLSDRDFFWGFVIPVSAAGFIAALALFFGVPWLWGLLKPLLHTVTA